VGIVLLDLWNFIRYHASVFMKVPLSQVSFFVSQLYNVVDTTTTML